MRRGRAVVVDEDILRTFNRLEDLSNSEKLQDELISKAMVEGVKRKAKKHQNINRCLDCMHPPTSEDWPNTVPQPEGILRGAFTNLTGNGVKSYLHTQG